MTATAAMPKCPDWIDLSREEMEIIQIQKAKATPSPKLFTLKDDGNNADGHFAELDHQEVLSRAKGCVNFLKNVGLIND